VEDLGREGGESVEDVGAWEKEKKDELESASRERERRGRERDEQ